MVELLDYVYWGELISTCNIKIFAMHWLSGPVTTGLSMVFSLKGQDELAQAHSYHLSIVLHPQEARCCPCVCSQCGSIPKPLQLYSLLLQGEEDPGSQQHQESAESVLESQRTTDGHHQLCHFCSEGLSSSPSSSSSLMPLPPGSVLMPAFTPKTTQSTLITGSLTLYAHFSNL